ncbi:hypothetical protein BB558_005353 [Smittium angustum]|uniref:Rap-GAP domain-containing protein n=1 Tax=Smittium angustum TaxID=133377 RepID=A0A2U1J0T7_SMIAN|nr:hypothetical protein BB558_005353 [Smittium angustum]
MEGRGPEKPVKRPQLSKETSASISRRVGARDQTSIFRKNIPEQDPTYNYPPKKPHSNETPQQTTIAPDPNFNQTLNSKEQTLDLNNKNSVSKDNSKDYKDPTNKNGSPDENNKTNKNSFSSLSQTNQVLRELSSFKNTNSSAISLPVYQDGFIQTQDQYRLGLKTIDSLINEFKEQVDREPIGEIVIYNAQDILLSQDPLSLLDLPIEKRLESVQSITQTLNQKKYFFNLSCLWDAIQNLYVLSKKDPLIASHLFSLVVAIGNSTLLVKELSKDISESCPIKTNNVITDGVTNISANKNIALKEAQNSFENKQHIEMTYILCTATKYEDIVSISKLLQWSTKKCKINMKSDTEFLETLYSWHEIIIQECLKNVPTLQEKNSVAINKNEAVLFRIIRSINMLVKNNHPALNDAKTAHIIISIIKSAKKSLFDVSDSCFPIKKTLYLTEIFALLSSSLKFGSLPLLAFEYVIKFVCLTVSFKQYTHLSIGFAKEIFLSCYIQEVAQCMMRMAMKANHESMIFSNHPSTETSAISNNKCSTKNIITDLMTIQGIIYSITRIISSRYYLFLEYNIAEEMFLPILLNSLEAYNRLQNINIDNEIISHLKMPIGNYKIEKCILKYLNELLRDHEKNSLTYSQWSTIVDILFYISEYIKKIANNKTPGTKTQEEPTQIDPKFVSNFYQALYSLCVCYDLGECEGVIWMRGKLVKLILSVIKMDGFPDYLAKILLKINDSFETIIPKATQWQNNLAIEVQILFLDTKRSLEVRQQMAELIKKKLLFSHNIFLTELGKDVLMKMASYILTETDTAIIESLSTICERILEECIEPEFLITLNLLKEAILKSKRRKTTSDTSFADINSTSFTPTQLNNNGRIYSVNNSNLGSNLHPKDDIGENNTFATNPSLLSKNNQQIYKQNESKPLLRLADETLLNSPTLEQTPNKNLLKLNNFSNSSDEFLENISSNLKSYQTSGSTSPENKEIHNEGEKTKEEIDNYRAIVASNVLTRVMYTFLSGKRAASYNTSYLYRSINGKKDTFNPNLTVNLMDAVLELGSNPNLASNVRCILYNHLFLIRVDLYHRVYIIESERHESLNYWRPVVFNPVFTHQVDTTNNSSHIDSHHALGTLILSQKYGIFDVKKYLESVTSVLLRDTSYEVVKIVATGLEVQLSNTYLFWACRDQVQNLLAALSSMLDEGKFGIHVQGDARLSSDERITLIVKGYRLLTRLILYKEVIGLNLQHKLVQSFQNGLSKGSHKLARPCIHALNICMLELPDVFRKLLPSIIGRLVQTYSALSMNIHILEFISALARHPELCINLVPTEFRTLLQIALNYIKNASTRKPKSHQNQQSISESSRDDIFVPKLQINPTTAKQPQPRPLALRKSISGKDTEKPRMVSTKDGITSEPSQKEGSSFFGVEEIQNDEASEYYVLVMAYQAIDIVYLITKPEFRIRLVDSLLQGLLLGNTDKTQISELNEVCIDMVLHYLFAEHNQILESDEIIKEEDLGETTTYSWAQGRGIATVRAQKHGRLAQIIVQRPSSSTSKIVDLPNMAIDILRKNMLKEKGIVDVLLLNPFKQNNANIAKPEPLPVNTICRIINGEAVQIPIKNKAVHFPLMMSTNKGFVDELISVYPQYMGISRPLQLPRDSPRIQRTLNSIKMNPTIDTHKIGVIYVGPKQTTEGEILSNTHGSSAYWAFLKGLGNVVRLSEVHGYNGGLDTSGSDLDGRYGLQWSDSISHIVFHVATLMPNSSPSESNTITQHQKKAHVGNDYVHIVFNESGSEYKFHTLISQFNFVQIIVTPGDISATNPDYTNDYDLKEGNKNLDLGSLGERLYWVQTQIRSDIPSIGPAMHPKLVTLSALPGLVRIAAIHANIFVQVYSSIKLHNSREYVSNWRQRLRSFKRLYESAFGQQGSSVSPSTGTRPKRESFGNSGSTNTSRSSNDPTANSNTKTANRIQGKGDIVSGEGVSEEQKRVVFGSLNSFPSSTENKAPIIDGDLQNSNLNFGGLSLAHKNGLFDSSMSPVSSNLESGTKKVSSGKNLNVLSNFSGLFNSLKNSPSIPEKNVKALPQLASHLGNKPTSSAPPSSLIKDAPVFLESDLQHKVDRGTSSKNYDLGSQISKEAIVNTNPFMSNLGSSKFTELSTVSTTGFEPAESQSPQIEKRKDFTAPILLEGVKSIGDDSSSKRALNGNEPIFLEERSSESGIALLKNNLRANPLSFVEQFGSLKAPLYANLDKDTVEIDLKKCLETHPSISPVDRYCLGDIDIFDKNITASSILEAIVHKLGTGQE